MVNNINSSKRLFMKGLLFSTGVHLANELLAQNSLLSFNNLSHLDDAEFVILDGWVMLKSDFTLD